MIDFQAVLLALVVVIHLFFLRVLFYVAKSQVRTSFIYVILSLIAWSISLLIYRMHYSNPFFLHLLYSVATFTAGSFLIFSASIYRFKENTFKFFALVCVAVNIVFFLFSFFTDAFVVEAVSGLDEPEIIFGKIYFVYFLYIVFFFLLGYLFIFLSYLNQKNLFVKKGYLLLFFAYFLGGSLGMTTNLVLPSLGFYGFNWIGPLFSLAVTFFGILVIFRYRVFNLEKSFDRDLWRYFLLVLFIVIYAVSANLYQSDGYGIFFISFCITLFLGFIDKYFFGYIKKISFFAEEGFSAYFSKKLDNVTGIENLFDESQALLVQILPSARLNCFLSPEGLSFGENEFFCVNFRYLLSISSEKRMNDILFVGSFNDLAFYYSYYAKVGLSDFIFTVVVRHKLSADEARFLESFFTIIFNKMFSILLTTNFKFSSESGLEDVGYLDDSILGLFAHRVRSDLSRINIEDKKLSLGLVSFSKFRSALIDAIGAAESSLDRMIGVASSSSFEKKALIDLDIFISNFLESKAFHDVFSFKNFLTNKNETMLVVNELVLEEVLYNIIDNGIRYSASGDFIVKKNICKNYVDYIFSNPCDEVEIVWGSGLSFSNYFAKKYLSAEILTKCSGGEFILVLRFYFIY